MKKNYSRVSSIFLLGLFIVFIMSSWSMASTAARPMVFAVRTEAVSLDPHVSDHSYSRRSQRSVYETLFYYEAKEDGSVEIQPLLAASYERCENAREYTFFLREGISFHDGTPFNAEAVKWNFDRIFALGSRSAASLPPFESIEVLDEYTVKITLQYDNPDFLEYISSWGRIISPAAAGPGNDWGENLLHDTMVGTGPFIFDEWRRGEFISVKRNPDYWRGWGENYLEGIVFLLASETTTRKNMMITGEADITDGLGAIDVMELERVPGVVVERHPFHQVWNLMLRNRGPLEHKEVRQAIAYAIDYDSIINIVFLGEARQAQGPVDEQHWSFDETVRKYETNLDKARELLAEAGYSQGFEMIGAFLSYHPVYVNMAEILQDNLRRIGITMRIEEYAEVAPWLAAIRNVETPPDLTLWHITREIDSPDKNLGLVYKTGATMNYAGYSNPQFDALMEEIQSTPRRSDRIPLYQEAQQIIAEEVPWIALASPNDYVVRRDYLQGVIWHQYMEQHAPDYYRLYLNH